MDETKQAAGCENGKGQLPGCAPLANPYVPGQEWGQRYCRADALAQGTLFPELNLPFHLAVQGNAVPKTPLSELQALCFVINELGLYLDTHPEDTEAFQLYQRYAELEKEGRKRYEAQFGPLTQKATAADSRYSWVDNPWPWSGKEGK